jgi:predicted lipoprotein with Yx(FWY)xxD motif
MPTLARVATAAVLAAVAAALIAPTATMAEPAAPPPAPAIKIKDSRFGNILATRGRKALYYWNVEKRDFKVHCNGACARAWPPLIVRSRAAVRATVPGIAGRFGVIKRPDGRLQVTHRRLPVYTYAHEGPNQVLCDNVDGWFVVRL